MASFWKTLGLDSPTNDPKVVRRAYAKTLRTTRPDEDPEGFMALREAFERAKNYAAYAADIPAEIETAESPSESLPEPANETPPAETEYISTSTPDKDEPREETEPVSLADYLPDELEPAVPRLPPIEIETSEIDQHGAADNPQDSIDPVLVIIESAETLLRSHSRNSKDKWNALLERGHDLSLDDYNRFEHRMRDLILEHFGYYDPEPAPPAGLKKLLPKPKVKSKGRIDKDTGIYIFKSLGWNRWKSYPDYIQSQLLYLLYELGIKERPKVEETGKAAIFSEFRFILKALAVAAVFGVLAFFTNPPDLPLPPRLPDAGDALYGSYSYSPEETKWTYKLSNDNEKVKTLKPDQVLIDSFEAQISDKSVMKILLTIKAKDGEKPEITHKETIRVIDTQQESGLNAIFILISGVAFGFAFFRGFFFGIGLIIGLIGVGFGILGDSVRRLFGR